MKTILGAGDSFSFLGSFYNHIAFEFGKCQQHGSHQLILRRVIKNSQVQNMNGHMPSKEFVDYLRNLSNLSKIRARFFGVFTGVFRVCLGVRFSRPLLKQYPGSLINKGFRDFCISE